MGMTHSDRGGTVRLYRRKGLGEWVDCISLNREERPFREREHTGKGSVKVQCKWLLGAMEGLGAGQWQNQIGLRGHTGS